MYAAEVGLKVPRDSTIAAATAADTPTAGNGASKSSSGLQQTTVSLSPPEALDWLDRSTLQSYHPFGNPGNSAQVHPYLLTTTLARLAEGAGAKIMTGSATAINYATTDYKSSVASVTYITREGAEAQIFPATDVLVATGPWSTRLLPSLKLLAPKGHSLVVRPPRQLSAHILFASIQLGDRYSGHPSPSPGPDVSGDVENDHPGHPLLIDIYPRPEDALHRSTYTVYASGPDYYDDPLPVTAASVGVEDIKCDGVWRAISGVSGEIRAGEVLTRQACYKAQIRKHEEGAEVGPMVGPLRDIGAGLWLTTGLDEWGIQNGPGVGLVMSEMILEGAAKNAAVESLDPKNWM